MNQVKLKSPLRVLVTGGTSGIGLAITEAFAAAGHSVLACGLEQNGAQICADLEARYSESRVRFSNRDLSVALECGALMEDCLAVLGGVDVLINNAGIQHVSPVEEFSPALWEKIISVNLSSAFYLSRAAFSIFKRQNFGRIIMIASAHGLRASEFKSAYVASKHGVLGLSKVLALEGAPFGITSNAICPGYVRTPLVEKQISDQAKAHGLTEDQVVSQVMLKKQAIKKFVEAPAIAALALHLCSDLGALISGVELPIDGGWTAQ